MYKVRRSEKENVNTGGVRKKLNLDGVNVSEPDVRFILRGCLEEDIVGS